MFLDINHFMPRKKEIHMPGEFFHDWLDAGDREPIEKLQRMLKNTTTRQTRMLNDIIIPENIPDPIYNTLFAIKKGKWCVVGYRCQLCHKIVNELNIMKRHPLICNNQEKINSSEQQTNEEDETMPIHRTSKGYYWGSKGPFPTKQKAEEVMRAAYSAGYKEPMKKKEQNK